LSNSRSRSLRRGFACWWPLLLQRLLDQHAGPVLGGGVRAATGRARMYRQLDKPAAAALFSWTASASSTAGISFTGARRRIAPPHLLPDQDPDRALSTNQG
jgi:hypothetical protein